MSGLKRFLKNREEAIAKEKAMKEETIQNETKNDIEDLDLSDDEFWAISNQFMKDIKNSDKSQEEILESILEDYTPKKIRQFAKRFEELNK